MQMTKYYLTQEREDHLLRAKIANLKEVKMRGSEEECIYITTHQ